MRAPTLEKRLHVYCQSDSLLLQFILSELLAIQPKIAELANAPPTLSDIDEEGLANLTNAISELVGGSVESTESFPWTPSHGRFGKLKNYCQLFFHEDESLVPVVADLKACSSRAFHALSQAQEVMRLLGDTHRRSNDLSELSALLENVVINMQKLSALLLRLIDAFGRDENVLFFLLQHHSGLSRLYHPAILREILEKLFDGGIEEARDYLIERYRARGFEDVIPQISQHIAELND